MKLTIVTISYNAEKDIEKTIKSVLKQTLPIYEYIFIDGKSADKTYDIIMSYKAEIEGKGIKFRCVSERDKGISDAFNKGIRLATGDFIGLINANDELLPRTCEILQKYNDLENVDILYGNCIWVDGKHDLKYISKPKHNLDDLLYRMVLIHPSTFIKRATYERIGVYDITYKYCMDKELLYRMYKAGAKFAYIDKPLTKFKAGGVSDTNAIAVFKEGSRMALSYGEPKLKVKIIECKKMAKTFVANRCKRFRFYKIIKQRRTH